MAGGGITVARALDVFQSELGSGGSRDDLIGAVTESLEFLLLNGGGEFLKEWCVPIHEDGRVVLPRDLRTPVKYRFGETPDLGYGVFHSPYQTYSSNGLNPTGYREWTPKMVMEANSVATHFKLPYTGARLVATTRDDRDVGKAIMVSGTRGGHKIAPLHNGYKTAGEPLTIYHEEDPDKKYSAYTFDTIESVVKDETCDYVMLSGIDGAHKFYHVAFYHPDETVPLYKEVRLLHWPKCSVVSYMPVLFILGRVDPSMRYIRDEELLPVASHELLRMLAKRKNYMENGDFKEQAALEQQIINLIRKYVAYQQPPGRSASVSIRGSGGVISNL